MLCPHCGEKGDGQALLCDHCSTLLDLLEPQGRCVRCFEERSLLPSGCCRVCRLHPSALRGCAASFSLYGPAGTLLTQLKRRSDKALVQGLAAYLVSQLVRLHWPLPYVVVPVPTPFLTHLFGNRTAQPLARAVASLLECDYLDALVRKEGELPQSACATPRRQSLTAHSFSLRSNVRVEDRFLLLIDDYQATGATLHACAQTLSEGFPKAIYGLTVCKQELYQGFYFETLN